MLGCGTIDLRKGADLFVNLARRVLLEERLDAASPGTWFLWIGHGGEDNLGAGSCTTLASAAWRSGSASSGREARSPPTTWPPICWR